MFAERAPSMEAVNNLALFASAFSQFSLMGDLHPAGADAIAAIFQRLRPMRERCYTSPRGALYALRVVNEAIGLELPVTASAVLGAARTRRSKIRKKAHQMPRNLVWDI